MTRIQMAVTELDGKLVDVAKKVIKSVIGCEPYLFRLVAMGTVTLIAKYGKQEIKVRLKIIDGEADTVERIEVYASTTARNAVEKNIILHMLQVTEEALNDGNSRLSLDRDSSAYYEALVKTVEKEIASRLKQKAELETHNAKMEELCKEFTTRKIS